MFARREHLLCDPPPQTRGGADWGIARFSWATHAPLQIQTTFAQKSDRRVAVKCTLRWIEPRSPLGTCGFVGSSGAIAGAPREH